MGLRRKTIGIATAILGVASVSGYTIARAAVSADRMRREADEGLREAVAARLMIADTQATLSSGVRDYSAWDRTYDFASGNYPEYVGSELTAATFVNLDIDVVLVLDTARTVIWAGSGDEPERKPVPATTGVDPLVTAVLADLPGVGTAEAGSGIAWVADVPWQFALEPIIKTDGTGVPAGTLLMARALSAPRLARFDDRVGSSVAIAREPVRTTSTRASVTAGTALPNPVGNGPVEVVIRRAPHAEHVGIVIDGVLAASIATTAIVGTRAILYVIDRLVLRRLAEFSATAYRIRRDRTPGLRLSTRGDDELDQLAVGINALLDQVESTNAQLRHEALHDPLTGLGNRSLLADRLDVELQQGLRRGQQRVALLFVDLDRLKPINDLLGHSAGDQFIATVAARLRLTVRAGDTVARLGGDEFGVILHDVPDAAAASALAERLLAAIRPPIAFSGREYEVTASIGVALPADGVDRENLLKQADTAMYAAKSDGGNRIAMYDEREHGREVGRGALEQDLRRALLAGEITVVYQPIIELGTGRIVAAEALARWNHADRGAVAPEYFVTVAEESDLVIQLDRYVLATALNALSRLRVNEPGLRVAVNHSARQMSSTDVVNSVVSALAAAQLPGSALTLELTETLLAKSELRWTEPMQQLVAHGVRFALDDFGMGFSSLSRLQHLPVAELKLDRVFVAGLATGEEPISRAIVGLANELRRVVIAEGVEHEWQVTRLRQMGCAFAQGYLFARPMPEVEFAAMLQQKAGSRRAS